MDDSTPPDVSSAGTPPRTLLPLFPLDTVLLPGTLLPLHVFEPRYRQLTVDLINAAEQDREFGVVTLRTPLTTEVCSPDQLYPIGCSTRLREAHPRGTGEFDIVTTGHRRFRLLDINPDVSPYLVGTVEWIDDDPVPEPALQAARRLASLAREAHRRYCEFAWDGEWSEPPAETDIGDLAYTLAADCLLPTAEQQRLLSETHPLRRLRMTREALTRETGLLASLRAVPASASHFLAAQHQANLN